MLGYKIRFPFYILFFTIVSITAISCTSGEATTILSPETASEKTQTVHTTAAPAYNYDKPNQVWAVDNALFELSGICFAENQTLLAIDDNHPAVFELNTGNSRNATVKQQWNFATDPKLDVEDIAYTGTDIYTLVSNGTLYKMNGQSMATPYPTFLSVKNDCEGLGYDPVTKKLLVACKGRGTSAKKKSKEKVVYSFNLLTHEMDKTPFLIIREDVIKAITGSPLDFNPSGIAVHPISHHIFILGSKGNKGIMEFTHEGKLISFSALQDKEFPQPEGLCFDKEGNLYISSEGATAAHAVLARFDGK